MSVRDKDRENEREILRTSERLDGPENTWHSDVFWKPKTHITLRSRRPSDKTQGRTWIKHTMITGLWDPENHYLNTNHRRVGCNALYNNKLMPVNNGSILFPLIHVPHERLRGTCSWESVNHKTTKLAVLIKSTSGSHFTSNQNKQAN